MFNEIFLTFSLKMKIFYKILPIPHNIVMALNNVMANSILNRSLNLLMDSLHGTIDKIDVSES